MLRVLVIAFAIVIAAASRAIDGEHQRRYSPQTQLESDQGASGETIYRSGFEYIYRYESQVLSGIPAASNQFAGCKINAIVRMQIDRAQRVILKMERVVIYTLNHVVHSSDSTPDDLSDVELTKLNGDQQQAMIEELTKPITFRYEGGEIREIKTTHSDKYWSINIKKGILSIFQVQLSGKSPSSWSSWLTDEQFVTDSMSSTHSKSQRHARNRFHETIDPIGSRQFAKSRLENTFQVMEVDVNGDCETKYVINVVDPSEIRSSVSDMVVSKVKNIERCLSKNTHDQGLFAHLGHLPSEKKLIQPSFEAEYVLTGDRHHFLIKKATVEAKYFFRPYGQDGGQMSTHISQKLGLQSTQEIETVISAENTVVDNDGLKMEIPDSRWTQTNAHQDETEWDPIVESQLNKLISAIMPVIREESSTELFNLQSVIKSIPRRQLVSIVKSYNRHGDNINNKKREILLDILPTSINPETGRALLDLIRDGTVHGMRAQLSITVMALTVRPTPDLVKSLMSFYREAESLERTNPHLRQTALLGVGVLCNKMINHERRVNKPIPELTDAVEEIAQELISLLSNEGPEAFKIMLLKAIGNMGAKELIAPIKEIVEDRSLPTSVRVEAVFALRKLAIHFNKQIHPLLMSVILNRDENVRVRIACVSVLKNALPSFTTLQLLTHSLRHSEPSTQVKSFIYSTLVSLSKFTTGVVEIQRVASDARKVLRTVRSIPVGVLDSKDIAYSTYHERLEMGATWNMETIKSETFGLPHTTFATLYSTVFGNGLSVFKFGVEGEMLTSILRRLFGPYGLLKDIIKNQASVSDLFKPFTRPEVSVQWKDFTNKNYARVTEDSTYGAVFGQTLGYDLFFGSVNEESVEHWVNRAISRAPELMNKLREGININTLKTVSIACNSIVLPTPMGIPVSLNFSTNAIFKLDGYVKATSLPSFVDFVRQRPFMTKKIEIDADLKPSWNIQAVGYMGADLKWLRTGAGIKADLLGSLPMKGSVNVDPNTSKLTLRFEPPTQDVKLFHAKVEPITFNMLVPVERPSQPYTLIVKTMKVKPSIKTFKYDNLLSANNAELNGVYKAVWSKCVESSCPYFPLNGKNELLFGWKGLSASPKEIVLTIKKFTQDWYNEESSEDFDQSSSDEERHYRTVSENDEEFSRDFENVSADTLITSPRKIELFVELAMNGYRSNKVVKGKITWFTENNYLEHHLNAQMICGQSGNVKVMMNTFWRCPMSVHFDSDQTQSHVVEPNDVLGKLELYWGENSFSEKTIKTKLWKLDDIAWRNELQRSGVDAHEQRHEQEPEAYNYGLEIVVPSVSYHAQQYLTKVHDMSKLFFYPYLTVGNRQSISQGKVVIFAQYVKNTEQMNLIVKTPLETDVVYKVPAQGPLSKPYRTHLHDDYESNHQYTSGSNFSDKTYIERFDEQSTYGHMRPSFKDFTPSLTGVCTMRKDKLMSFDGTPILLPHHHEDSASAKCDVVLASDCSDKSTFAVTGSFKNGHWAVKAVVPSHRVEIVPKSSHEIEVKVDGQEITVGHAHSVKIYQVTGDSSMPKVISIRKLGTGYKVELHETGITITMSEHSKITIKVSPVSMLQGRLCGLCGNNNYDIGDDLKTFEGKLTNSRSFVSDNVMQSEQCDVNDYKHQLNVRHERYCKEQKTMLTKKTLNNEEMECFSKNPMMTCSARCSLESTKTENVQFICLPVEDSDATRLINMYQDGQVDLTRELSQFKTNHQDPIEVPDKCVNAY